MSTRADPGRRVRRCLRVSGVVQGVGFRPFLHRLAGELGLGGHAGNDACGVFVEVEGPASAVALFEARLHSDAPPLARVERVEAATAEPRGETDFKILESRSAGDGRTYVSPDVAVCRACLTEMFDPADRRYRYPFINCTDCGPRFTITVRLPYDRPNTTMAGFKMCAACAAEYGDPADRRFHAQPVACGACGPSLFYEEGSVRVGGSDAALAAAQAALAAGGIVAVKGLGGYHLACDATSERAVAELRRRKGRGEKPFAVMVKDLASAARLAEISPAEAALLESPQRPIVLLRRSEGSAIADPVAPANPYLGVLLPYTPVHHLLFAPVPGAEAAVPEVLVMTSGNLSEEPICFDDADARDRLGDLADAWLAHDRPICVPCDDSVVRVEAGEELPMRRSRGYAPLPVRLPFSVPASLGAGGELKNTFCLASGADAWLSQHIGDMGSPQTVGAFERSVRQFSTFYQVTAGTVAADAHPGYQTRRWAEGHASRVRLVQHHHAHVCSLMAEHGLGPDERVIGFAFDGTGYGDDGAIWGGEVLVASYRAYERVGHLAYFPLPGGDASIRRPYRAALALLWAAGVDWDPRLAPVRAARPSELGVLARQLERNVACVPCSSMGRLFDGISSLLDLRHEVSYEAQAAIELEVAAEDHLSHAPRYWFGRRGPAEYDPAPLLRAAIADLQAGVSPGSIAAGFHLAVAGLIGEAAVEAAARSGVATVALTGGVFQNVLITRLARQVLGQSGLRVLTHRLVPPNDGGLALGQVVAVAAPEPIQGHGDGADPQAAARPRLTTGSQGG